SEWQLCPQCGRSPFDLALILCAAAANGGSEPKHTSRYDQSSC
ncbi:MAG: hypothetical protein ACI9TA_001060, partial [Reinekea sp.]